MTFDGIAERTSIIARLTTLGSRVDDSPESWRQAPIGSDGKIVNVIVPMFGATVPTLTDRNFEGDTAQPHIFPISIACSASTAGKAFTLGASVATLLTEWNPNEPNSDVMKAAGGYAFTDYDPTNKPIRWHQIRQFTVNINLSRS